jgi:hypothetical protein
MDAQAVLPLALKSAITNLQEADGRVAGLKLNKLIYELFRQLSTAKDAALHFTLPHRWYLFGAVIDDRSLASLVRFDHPEDEYKTNAVWVGPAKPRVGDAPDGLLEEIEQICAKFAHEYAGPEGIAPMLRDHYRSAPLQFQRDFLEWSLLSREILRGYRPDSPALLQGHFSKMLKSYPADLEPRLTPAFQRLMLFLEPKVANRTSGDLAELEAHAVALWDFWTAFCQFLSISHNHGIPPERLAGFRSRAERELVGYKRRLTAYLEQGYLREAPPTPAAPYDFSEIGAFLSEEIRATLGADDPFGSR